MDTSHQNAYKLQDLPELAIGIGSEIPMYSGAEIPRARRMFDVTTGPRPWSRTLAIAITREEARIGVEPEFEEERVAGFPVAYDPCRVRLSIHRRSPGEGLVRARRGSPAEVVLAGSVTIVTTS